MATKASSLISTTIDISQQKREKLVHLLNERLADISDLKLQVKQAHWNLKGPNFIGLHKLFDEIEADVAEWTDLVAERAVILGGVALGTLQNIAKSSTLSEYPTDIHAGRDHAEAVTRGLAETAKQFRAAIEECGELEDAVSEDIFTEITRGLDKYRWFVEAHLQADA